MMILPRLAVGLLLALAAPAVGFPNRMNDARTIACAGGNCATMGGHGGPQQQNGALTVTGKQDGGTYTPGETLNVQIGGNGQYMLAGVNGNNVIDGGENAQGTITAPQTGDLVIIGFASSGSGQTVTKDRTTRTL